MWLSVVSGWVQERAGHLGLSLGSVGNLLCEGQAYLNPFGLRMKPTSLTGSQSPPDPAPDPLPSTPPDTVDALNPPVVLWLVSFPNTPWAFVLVVSWSRMSFPPTFPRQHLILSQHPGCGDLSLREMEGRGRSDHPRGPRARKDLAQR